MADEPVVVLKARPVKASNGVEGKTKPTFTITCKSTSHCQKRGKLRRGEVVCKSLKNSEKLMLSSQAALLIKECAENPSVVMRDSGATVVIWTRGVIIPLH